MALIQYLLSSPGFYVLILIVGCIRRVQGRDKTAEERRIAICIFDDVAEQCRDAAFK